MYTLEHAKVALKSYKHLLQLDSFACLLSNILLYLIHIPCCILYEEGLVAGGWVLNFASLLPSSDDWVTETCCSHIVHIYFNPSFFTLHSKLHNFLLLFFFYQAFLFFIHLFLKEKQDSVHLVRWRPLFNWFCEMLATLYASISLNRISCNLFFSNFIPTLVPQKYNDKIHQNIK